MYPMEDGHTYVNTYIYIETITIPLVYFTEYHSKVSLYILSMSPIDLEIVEIMCAASLAVKTMHSTLGTCLVLVVEPKGTTIIQ